MTLSLVPADGPSQTVLRREFFIEAAIRTFSEVGYRGASVETIAAAAGISPSYLLRLFKSKSRIFEECIDLSFARMSENMAAAATGFPHGKEAALAVYNCHMILTRRQDVDALFELQAFAASATNEVFREAVHAQMAYRWRAIRDVTGLAPLHIKILFALCQQNTSLAKLGLTSLVESDAWAADVTHAVTTRCFSF
ncbi:TetR/AcrR family transcriptional regulator [Tsukamurella ocularis]|uniref:TetR/AcrR family transcriptional regulator n=1 Tax=Tsukamurella ocularis TaxID=1970234 RepID=UPI002167C0C6|nr:TetR/AcrR family transcriptional regulator [Tsukamurella ocularis]MCS3779343.1 AcrR family transcriptional regulator [Tsukamurella ocularis]MCS3789931.1 AcrR family transcriptional regulator [Tsukamurella ocularis]MCS3852428.1 AcrR family transcriptional regulator [Tsukamurella ocularis]